MSDKQIIGEAGKKARDEFAEFMITQMIKAAEAAAGRRLKEGERKALEATAGIVNDTMFFIMDEMAGGKVPSKSALVGYANSRIARLGVIADSEMTLCVTAVVDLALTLLTQYPLMASAIKGAIVTTGIGFSTGGAGLIFAAGAWGVVGVSAALIFLSATETANQCVPVMEERWANPPPRSSAAPLRPVVSRRQQTDFALYQLQILSSKGERCEIPRF